MADLDDGEHNVKLEVNGPQNMTWSLPRQSIRVKSHLKQPKRKNNGQDEEEENHSERIHNLHESKGAILMGKYLVQTV
ncbi:hypothetical protein PO124_33790 [Bacillus licheniformis]|nr:hypothetical protein [Bacillus licheniformis]